MARIFCPNCSNILHVLGDNIKVIQCAFCGTTIDVNKETKSDILKTNVDLTILGGQIIFDRFSA